MKYWNILANGIIGRYNAAGNRFDYLKDHLGSTRVVVNTSSTVVEAHDYYPFGLLMPGRDYQSGSQTKEKFTGKERDEETGWDWFNPGRYYVPSLGRWISIDPIYDNLDPQNYPYHSTSSYAYSLNNPVLYVDENGKWVATIQLSGRAQVIVTSGSVSIGMAVDDKGNVGLMTSGSVGGGIGIGIAGGLEASFFPAAKNIDEISGIGTTAGLFIGIPGDMIGGEINTSFLQEGGQLTGDITDFRLGGSLSGIPGTGSGAGAGLFLELSYTHISKSLRLNLGDLFGSGKQIGKDNDIVKQLQYKLGLSADQVVELLTRLNSIFEYIKKKSSEDEDGDKKEEEK